MSDEGTGAPYCSDGTLKFKDGNFILDGKQFRILGGTMHYFRVFPEYWKDRMLKMKACGLNTVETYVAWNQHEEYPGQFDFERLLNVRKFIETAQEVGLYVIFRPGPYICAEWDFGGLPSWLLSDPNMKVRSNYPPYQEAVERFFAKLLPQVLDLQHVNGGPIIAVQVENEFGSYSDETAHLSFIKQLLVKYGIKELLLTSENIFGIQRGAFYQHALPTGNFPNMEDGQKLFDTIRKWSPDFPLMVTEFWPGWFDHWGNEHKGLAMNLFEDCLTGVLDVGGSVNMYMFHGGTNFGFMSGANYFTGSTYKPDVTSYDYDAPLSEAGDITPKFLRAREIISEKVKDVNGLPDIPSNTPKKSYGKIDGFKYMSFEDILTFIKVVESAHPVPMEYLKIHDGYGQNYGYILYRTNVPPGKKLVFTSSPKDRAQVFVNGEAVCVMDWKEESLEISINCSKHSNVIDILVENHGRINYIEFGLNRLNEERKGISGDVLLDGRTIDSWRIYPIEFRRDDVTRVLKSDKWSDNTSESRCPCLLKTTLNLNEAPCDTFLNMEDWGKGIVFINDFNLGRYWSVGPQQTLFVPAPLLRQGANQILIFEQEKISSCLNFIAEPILDKIKVK